MSTAKTTYIYKSVDNCDIHADVYRVPGELNPAILWLHGGMVMAGSRADLPRKQLERYLQAGFTVVSADYRLAPETQLPNIVPDLQDVFDWMRATGPKEFGVDPDRIGVVGHSAGGYLTLLAGHRLDPRPRALVAFYGYSDIDGDWYNRPDPYYCQFPPVTEADARAVIGSRTISQTPGPGVSDNRGRFYLYCRQQGRWAKEVAGYDPRVQPRELDPLCPIRNVTADYPPTLLIHGALDTDVPHEQSAQMARELERQGVPHEFVSLPKHGHAFEIAEGDMLDPVVSGTFDTTIAFLREHTRGR
jgi:acetyl esterase/lipase